MHIKSNHSGADGVEIASLTKIRNELKDSLAENARLKARVYDAECEISDLKHQLQDSRSDLRDTQALLGKAVVTASRQGRIPEEVAGPSRARESLKRARSPSLEIVDVSTIKGKGKEIKTRPIPSSTTHVPLNKDSVSSPPSTALKAEKELPAPSQKNDVKIEESSKRRKIDSTPQSEGNAVKETSQKLTTNTVSPNPAPQKPTDPPTANNLHNASTPKTVPTNKSKSKDVFILPDSVIKIYIKSAKTLQIVPPPSNLEVPRTFLRLAYGGSDQQFLQCIKPEMNPSGPNTRRIVFPMLDLNPAMPSSPGEPGLVFASRHEILSNPPWTVFCKRDNSKAVWWYLGEYECVLCGKMTAKQFNDQKPVVKQEWAKLLLKSKLQDVYVAMRARIALRHSGVLPAKDEETEDNLIKAEMLAIKSGEGRQIEEKVIIDAFCAGDEGIDIIRMNCVKYDHVFVNDMMEKFPNYGTLLAASKKKKENIPITRATRKRPRPRISDDEKFTVVSEDNDEPLARSLRSRRLWKKTHFHIADDEEFVVSEDNDEPLARPLVRSRRLLRKVNPPSKDPQLQDISLPESLDSDYGY